MARQKKTDDGAQTSSSKRDRGPAFRDDLADGYAPRMKARYREQVVPQLLSELSLGNVMAVPRLDKIVINMGLGEATRDGRLIDIATRDLQIIAGQKPVVTRARKSVAGFKVRQGMPIGAKVTLRGDRMWEFLDRLLSVALPRIRDFRGLSPSSFDGTGNYTMGVTEQLIFPEIEYDKVERQLGFDITVATTARDDEQGYQLLRALGFPFQERTTTQAKAG